MLINNEELGLLINNNQIVVSSRTVAEKFDKRHSNVLQSIRNTIRDLKNDSDFVQMNFHFVENIEKCPGGAVVDRSEYFLTRDGFALVAMGFTGSRVMEFKLKYIAAFNEMERQLRTGGFTQPNTVQDVVKLLATYATAQQAEVKQLAGRTDRVEEDLAAQKVALVNVHAAVSSLTLPLSIEQRAQAMDLMKSRYAELRMEWSEGTQYNKIPGSCRFIMGDIKLKFGKGLSKSQFRWHDIPSGEFSLLCDFIRRWVPSPTARKQFGHAETVVRRGKQKKSNRNHYTISDWKRYTRPTH